MNAETSREPHTQIHTCLPSILDLLLFALAFNLTCQPLVEPDFGWHLRAGLDLIAQGWTLPDTDPYSHTMPDWRWVEHAWLTDGILGLLYQGLEPVGALAVIVLFAIATTVAWWIASAQAAVPQIHRWVAIVVSLWVALPFLGARTQLISLLGVAMTLRIVSRIQQGHGQWIWALPVLFICWANLHGGFTAGLFLFGVIVSGGLVVRICVDRWPALAASMDERVLSWADLQRIGLAFGMAAAVTFLNPYGWRLYGEIYQSLTDRFMLDTLREWQPVSFQGWAGRAYGSYLIGLAVLVSGWYRRVEPVRWLILVTTLTLSLLHLRNVTLFLIVSLPLLAELLAAAAETCLRLLPLLKTYANGIRWIATAAAASVLLLWGPDHLSQVWRSGSDPESYFEQTDYPIEAIRWIRDHRDQVGNRLYNDYGYGGFLLWLLPEAKIFIDGRMPAWRIGSRSIFHDYVDLNRDPTREISLLDRYQIDWAFIPRDIPLALVLQTDPVWKVLYSDSKAVILRRRQG
jgi:hypothetical protein